MSDELYCFIFIQGRILKEYPSKLLFTTIQCLLSTVQSFLLAIAFERDLRQWKLGLDVKLIAIAYSVLFLDFPFSYFIRWVNSTGWAIRSVVWPHASTILNDMFGLGKWTRGQSLVHFFLFVWKKEKLWINHCFLFSWWVLYVISIFLKGWEKSKFTL